MINTPKYFELSELLKSDTALSKKIENLPTWEGVEKLNKLVVEYLDPLREAWGSAITITSGYRSPNLNKAVGGVSNSSHQYYEAVDLQPKDTSVKGVETFFNFIKNYFTDNDVIVDQCFIEKSGSTTWVHLGISPRMRNQYGELRV